MLLYVFFGGKNVPMEFMCHFSRKAWIRWDPPVLPDRVSPLGIGGAQSICEPPRTEGGRIELLSMLSSLFCVYEGGKSITVTKRVKLKC